jgi:hypothetical protein
MEMELQGFTMKETYNWREYTTWNEYNTWRKNIMRRTDRMRKILQRIISLSLDNPSKYMASIKTYKKMYIKDREFIINSLRRRKRKYLLKIMKNTPDEKCLGI